MKDFKKYLIITYNNYIKEFVNYVVDDLKYVFGKNHLTYCGETIVNIIKLDEIDGLGE